MRDEEQRAQGRKVGDQVGEDAGGLLAVVAVPVALGCGLQAGKVLGDVAGEGLVDVGPGGECRSGEAGRVGQQAARKLGRRRR
ncbi:hypothetical protein [Streptomyces sp. NPDC046759]|uniref:hypothetical protein n=1 Tax=Streptomyces sp. NPDC046759 TaxID=3155019 RepID=UPI0033FE09CC